jgi:hypothetical protein
MSNRCKICEDAPVNDAVFGMAVCRPCGDLICRLNLMPANQVSRIIKRTGNGRKIFEHFISRAHKKTREYFRKILK